MQVDVIALLLLWMIRCSVYNDVLSEFLHEMNICLLLRENGEESDLSSNNSVEWPQDNCEGFSLLAEKHIGYICHDHTGFVPDELIFKYC